jgi:Protein of unknown function (DUF3592)
VDAVKHFDIWFGGLFLLIGVIALIVGAGVGIVFIRKPPRQRSTWVFLALPMSLGLVFTTLGGVFAGNGLAAYQLEQRLLASGVTTRARVVEVERTNTRLNGRYLWQVRYEYRDPTGRAHEGISGYLERIEAQSYQIGDQAFVRYDPAEPSASIWLGREDRASASTRSAGGRRSS